VGFATTMKATGHTNLNGADKMTNIEAVRKAIKTSSKEVASVYRNLVWKANKPASEVIELFHICGMDMFELQEAIDSNS
jgi:hypothetical protein